MAKKLFSDDDFDKSLSIGDELVFDKPELTKLKIDLTWVGTDLDLCAFMLGKDGMIHQKEDLVYFNSRLRWKTEKDFNDEDFNPLKGSFSQWPATGADFRNPRRWMEATLPISTDGSVIGSWDDKAEDEDDNEVKYECMHILLDEVDIRKYSSIVFAAVVARERINIGETFMDAHDPAVTIYNAENDKVIAEYKLASAFPGKDAVCFGRMEFDNHTFLWNYQPMDEAYNGGMHYLATEVYN